MLRSLELVVRVVADFADLDGILADESFFAFIAHADDGDDWLDEATWRKANPNYGVSVNPEDMRALALKAASMPAAAATFKQKRLNLWVNATAPCLSVEGWRRGQTRPPTGEAREAWLDELLHERCYIGIDLATLPNLAAFQARVAARPAVQKVLKDEGLA